MADAKSANVRRKRDTSGMEPIRTLMDVASRDTAASLKCNSAGLWSCIAQAQGVCSGHALVDSGRTAQSWPGAAQAGRPPGTQRTEPQGAQDNRRRSVGAFHAGARSDAHRLKYQLMAESPFAYFRGAVPVMAADLAVLPSTGIVCQLCAMRTHATWAHLPRRTGGWSSTSTTLTEPSPAPFSGT